MTFLELIAKSDTTNAAAKATGNLSFTSLITQTVDKIVGWGETAFRYLPNFIVAVIILTIFYFIAKVISKFVVRFLSKVTDNRTIIDLIETVIGVILIAVGVFLALAVVNLSGIVTTLLAGAGIIALALGFAFREIVANFIAGIYISIRQPFRKGDIIDSEDHYGTVQKIFLRCTIIRTPQGQIVYIPNSDVIGKVLINYTQNHERRIDLACRISYGDDLKKAKQIAIEAIKGLDCYNKNKPVQLVYDEFGLNAIKFKVRFWVNFKKQWDFVSARSEAIMAITQKFKEEDLKIPFPVRTLDFDVRRGEKLDAMLPNGGAKPAKIDGDSEEEV